MPHVVEGGKVLTNASAPLPVRFITNRKNYDSYSAWCIEVIAARLAVKCAHWITGKTSYVQIAQAAYDEAWKVAWALDAMEGDAPRAADEQWIDAR